MYVGAWMKDKMTGRGVYYNTQGYRLEGKFIDGQMKDRGTILYPADHELREY